MSTSNENGEHTSGGGSMLRELQLKGICEVSHNHFPTCLSFASCTESCFAQTNNVKMQSVLIKNYSSCFTLPEQPHQGKENISGERLLS